MLSIIEKVLLLKQVSLFRELPGEVLASVADAMEEVFYRSGRTIIRQGDVGDCLYCVVDGKASVEVDGTTVAQLGPGEPFGEMSLLDSEPRNASIVARSDVILLMLDQGTFYVLMEDLPQLTRGVITTLSRRLREMNRRNLSNADIGSLNPTADPSLRNTNLPSRLPVFDSRLLRVKSGAEADAGELASG